MSPKTLALAYLNCLFKTGNLVQLEKFLAPDLDFQGPFYQFQSAAAYLQALRKDPPEGFNYKLIKSFEEDTSVCLIYRFSKAGVSTLMTQWFVVENDKINKITLIFDTAAFP